MRALIGLVVVVTAASEWKRTHLVRNRATTARYRRNLGEVWAAREWEQAKADRARQRHGL